MSEQWTVKSVDGVEPKSAQEQEQAVVETAAAETPNVEVENNEPIKVNLDAEKVPEQDQEAEEQPQESEPVADTVEQPIEGEHADNTESEAEPVSALELITDDDEPEAPVEVVAPVQEVQEPEPVPQVYPEEVEKLMQFIEDTGGSVEDYAKLNRNLDEMNEVDTIKDYYREKYPHMSEERLERKMNKSFLYDEDSEEPDAIQDKKDLFEDELYEARNFLQKRKDKYYTELKLRRQQELTPELREASEFYNEHKATQESTEKLVKAFQDRTNKVFNEEFKGFDFKVGENKYRYKVQDAVKVKETQSDLNNFINEFTGPDGSIEDAAGYHKALFAARNADKLAQHFYEQGKADAVRQSAKDSKNIDMNPRSDASAVVTPSGTRVRVVSGDTSGGLKFKMRK